MTHRASNHECSASTCGRSPDRTTAIIGGKIKSGTPCEACGKTYAACTLGLLYDGKGACCGRCGYTGTHQEREEGTVTQKERVIIPLTDIEGLNGLADTISAEANGYGKLESCTITLSDERHQLVFKRGVWALELQR